MVATSDYTLWGFGSTAQDFWALPYWNILPPLDPSVGEIHYAYDVVDYSSEYEDFESSARQILCAPNVYPSYEDSILVFLIFQFFYNLVFIFRTLLLYII